MMTEKEMQFELMKSQEKVNALRQEVAEMNKEREYWQQVRIELVGRIAQGLSSNSSYEQHELSDFVTECLTVADALIAELKKGGQDGNNDNC